MIPPVCDPPYSCFECDIQVCYEGTEPRVPEKEAF